MVPSPSMKDLPELEVGLGPAIQGYLSLELLSIAHARRSGNQLRSPRHRDREGQPA